MKYKTKILLIPDLQELIEKINKWYDVVIQLNINDEEFIIQKDQISDKYLDFYRSFYEFKNISCQKTGYDISNRLWILDNKFYNKNEINNFINDNLFELSKEDLIKEFTIYYNKLFNVKKNNYQFMFITVRPSTETRFTQFQKLVEKAFTKKWIDKYIYVYEQKGKEKDTIGDGFHIHALVDIPDNKPNSDIYREFRNTFKKVCGPKGVHFYPCTESLREEKLGYIGCTKDYQFINPNTYDFKKKAGKKDEEKCKCLPFDEEFRINNFLELCYTNN